MLKTHYWLPVPALLKKVENLIYPHWKVLELGPGTTPFSKATHFCGWEVGGNKLNARGEQCDFNKEKLPYKNKEFDFIYCRHVLEDLWNPFNLIPEIIRVGKAGWIETPSPIAEMCKYANGEKAPFRGYHHHHWIVWNDGKKLNFLHKCPAYEVAPLPEEELEKLLEDPVHWNTYLLWSGAFEFTHYQIGVNCESHDQIVSAALTEGAQKNIFIKATSGPLPPESQPKS